MDPRQIRKTIPDLIQQTTLARIQLEGLAGRPTLPNPIIPSLHIEVYLLEKAISDLKESLIDAGRLFPRENVETTREIDLSLFATSITLSNMVKQLHQLENPPLVKRKSRFPFGNDRNSRKELDMNNDLSDLHSCHNALRMQIMRLDPREAGEQVPKALQSNSILIEKTVAQIVRRGSFNAEPCPTYVAGLWPDRIKNPFLPCKRDTKCYPLGPRWQVEQFLYEASPGDLQGGLLEHNVWRQRKVEELYRRCGISRFVAKHILLKWKGYSVTEEDSYFRAITLLKRSGYDLHATDVFLTEIHKLGDNLYYHILERLEKWNYNVRKTVDLLQAIFLLAHPDAGLRVANLSVMDANGRTPLGLLSLPPETLEVLNSMMGWRLPRMIYYCGLSTIYRVLKVLQDVECPDTPTGMSSPERGCYARLHKGLGLKARQAILNILFAIEFMEAIYKTTWTITIAFHILQAYHFHFNEMIAFFMSLPFEDVVSLLDPPWNRLQRLESDHQYITTKEQVEYLLRTPNDHEPWALVKYNYSGSWALAKYHHFVGWPRLLRRIAS